MDLPDHLARALEAEAARRGMSVDELVVESVAQHVEGEATRPARERFGFVGMGRSGDGELSTRFRDYRRAAAAERSNQRHFRVVRPAHLDAFELVP
ncbi:MAG: hypothetical protein U5R31_05605 [Acidimicrobiia bacterium]|nr:hypothetical protein [Acidimicrobiia bacterium]